jgi:hypothetical protein
MILTGYRAYPPSDPESPFCRSGRVWTSTTDSKGVFELVYEPTNCNNYYNGRGFAWTNMVDGTNVVDTLVEGSGSIYGANLSQ